METKILKTATNYLAKRPKFAFCCKFWTFCKVFPVFFANFAVGKRKTRLET